MDNEIDNNECFCELCSLDFTTSRELEEHTWSILHNTNLNRKKGRDCAHPCSLCKQQFTGLLEFTSHLHGDIHQEKIQKWRKDHQQEWSPDKQQQDSPEKETPQRSDIGIPQNPDKQKLERPRQEKEEGELSELSDWAADDWTAVKDFQNYSSDQGGEAIMNDYRRGHQHHQSWPGRGPPRNIPSLLDPHLPPVGRAVEYGYHYQDELEMRRGRGPNQPWPNERWEPNDRGYPNDGRPVWDGGDRERDFRGPPYNPGYAGMNHSRNSDDWQNESYYGSREGDRMPSRDSSRSYPNDNFSDGYAPGHRRRVFVEGEPGDLRDRINRRGSDSSHPPHNGRQNVKSVVGSSFMSSRDNEERPYSRQNRREGPVNRRYRETPPHKQDQGRRRTSQENKQRDSRERSQAKASPSSQSPSGKSARKSKPRKLARSEERNKDVSSSENTASKSVEVNFHPSKDKESERKNKDETKTMEKDKDQTESVASSQQVDGNKNGKSSVGCSGLLNKDPTVKKPSMMNGDVDSKGNASSPTKMESASLSKGDSPSSTKRGLSSSPAKRKSSSSVKKDTSSSAKGDSASSDTKNTSPSPVKGESSSSAKGNSSSPGKKYITPLSAKGDSSSSVKEGSSLSAKKNPTSPMKEHSIPPAKRDSSLPTKGVLPSSTTMQSSLLTNGDSSSSTKEDLALTVDTEQTAVKNVKPSVLKGSEKQENLTNSFKSSKELITYIPENETLVTSLHAKINQSQDSREAANIVFIEKEKEATVSKVGAVLLSSASDKKDLVWNDKEQAQSLSSVIKDKEDYSTRFTENTNYSLPENKIEKTADNQGPNISRESEQRNKSSTISTISSLPWEQREEQLRALLGIKKEPKDLEDQQDTTACTVPKVTVESQTNCPISSGSIPTLSSSSYVKSKPNTSRHVPVVSQLSLSRPQCSFVHIDGVQCGAVTWNKYCSYHQRVFKSEEGDTHEGSLVAEGSQFRRNDSESSDSVGGIVRGCQSGTRIFRPITPPYGPPEHFDVDGVKTRQKQEHQSEDGRNARTSFEEIDLNSTVPYAALRASNGPRGNVDLGTTVRAATRNLFLRESSANANSGPSIDTHGDTVPTAERALKPRGITLEDTTAADTGIDLSGTVPNLEELLALHGSSADKSSGPKIDLSKSVLKHGQSWNQQRLKADRRPNTDRNLTAPYHGAGVHLGGSSIGGDNGASIDLNETVAQPGRSRAPLDSTRFDNTDHKKAQAADGDRLGSTTATSSSVVQHSQDNTVPDRESSSAPTNSNLKTEMIDLNLSTKLLGVPHSVVTPFNASSPSPKGPAREISKSPSELSTKSSILASRIYSPSSNVATSPMPGDQSPSPTISLPNFSLDLSRFNLPPAVRKALAERYSGKKVSSATGASSAEFSDGRRSQPLFTDHTRTEGQIEPGKKLSPLPARLRSRGQRSVSLDSPLIRKDNLHVEGTSRSTHLERGNIYDMNRFLSRPLSEMSEGRVKSDLISSGHNSEGFLRRSSVVLPSTNVPSLSTQSSTATVQKDSNELQSRGLIDLSSTSYLGEISVTSANHGRSPAATRLSIDKPRSPARPSVLQSRGLIDLNTSMELSTRDAASPETLSVIKRKRVNSTEGSETSSSSGTEKLVKRLKQEQASAREDAAATYRPGINVQELLTIEREEQNQLQSLHAVQSRLKSVRAQIQKLCTELDSLSGEEQRITLKMGELRNQRLSILENACYERQGPATRLETVTRESSTSTADDNRSFSVSSGSGKCYTLDLSNSARQSNFQDDNLRAKKMIDYGSYDMDVEQTATEEVFVGNNTCTSHDKDEESLFNVSNFSDGPKLEARVSVGTATKFVSKGETQHHKLPHEKVLENLYSAKQTESSNQLLNFNEGAKNIIQASDTQLSEQAASRELAERIPARHQDSDPSDCNGDYGLGAVTVPGTRGDAAVQNQNRSNKVNETRKDLMKKMKQVHLPDKGPFRKKSYSDVNISKTIEASRKKIQSVRENMKRWKSQEERECSSGPNDNEKRKRNSSSSLESVENPFSSDLDEDGSSCKMPVRDKTSSRKTTKELKKSSLFQYGKKSSKEVRKNKVDKTQLREKEKPKQTDAVPVKRRKIEDTSCKKSSFVLSKEKTSSKEKSQVVSAAAHTTTTDLEGSGSEERNNTEDEIPTRDVDNQSRNTSSKNSRRATHLQIPSSTVESLKKSLQNGKDGRQRGPLAAKFPGHTGAVCGLKVHNGHLFTCSADKTTRSFNIQTGQCVKMYQGHHQAVNCIEVSTDKDRLFTGSNDQTVRSYNIKSDACTHKFTFDGRVMCLHAAFDLLFVGLSTGVVASIDLLNNICLERFHCHEPRGVSCLTTATEGQRKLLCSGSFDSTIAIRDYQSGLLIRTLCDHNMTVLCLQVVENILYSGSADMKVQAHNLNSGELLRSFEGHTMSVSGLQIVGSVLVTSCLDKLIRCYDLTSTDLVQVYGGQMDMIFSVHVNNGRIYSGARDGSVVAVKLDLRVYHPCKWRDCNLNFGVVMHLKNHIREYHVMEQGTVEACHWADCGHQFSADDNISVVLKHVLGHVVTRTARKSAN